MVESPVITSITPNSVAHRGGAAISRISELRALKDAARRREEKLRKQIVLPELSKELGVDFKVTIKRGSMTDLALTPDCPPAALEYVGTFIEQMNKAAFNWARSGVDVETMTEEETKVRNRELGLKTTENIMEEFGGVEYERKRREMADAFCLIFVVDPEVVPTEDDVEFEDSQIALDMIPESDRLFIQSECQTQEEEAVKRDLKSVSPDDDEAEDDEGAPLNLAEGKTDGDTAAAVGDAGAATSNADWTQSDGSGDEPQLVGDEPAVLASYRSL